MARTATKAANDEPQSNQRKRRKRRSTEEIRSLIADAAFVEFGKNGFSNTTTAMIARRAEVAEALIFNHFETKDNLYRIAVFKPLNDHFANFMRNLDPVAAAARNNNEESREFVSDLVHFVRRNADVFKSLVVNEAYANKAESSSGLRGLQDYFNTMAEFESKRLKKRPKVSPHLIARISFAAILGATIFDDWLFPVGISSEREIHEAICDFIMDGINTNYNMRN